MKRRDCFKKGAEGALAAGLVSLTGCATAKAQDSVNRNTDNWKQLSSAQKGKPSRKQTVTCDVAVLGGGLAGICAAVSAARNGARTVLVQDRPVLGGNSSSEIRVHVNGVTHQPPKNQPERETGIIEEILLLNRFMNPQESWPVWDHVLYEFVMREPNLELMLNTQAVEAKMSGNTIKAAVCWQATTETEITITAKQFIDCSGDGLLAATAGALYRTGREGKAEFNEKYAPETADGWTMGASLLWSTKDMGKPVPFEAPSYAIKYDPTKAHHHRKLKNYNGGIWWCEIGSEFDIIGDQEVNREKLMGYMYGLWDYIKNSGECPEADQLVLDWVGSVPGRRESRRFLGDYMLSESDLTGDRHFNDAIAYGGWSLDEHNPGGIENSSEPPSYFHQKFSYVYEIPYRCLYSKNISNLSFAGRNISQTHIALSSSRVMGTCALEGQAAGTAAAICVTKGVNPRAIAQQHIDELQEQLLRDDAFIPNRPAEDLKNIALKAGVISASSTVSGSPKLLTDGMSRDFEGQIHHWESLGLPAEVLLEWEKPAALSKVEIKCDTNVKRNILMRKDSKVSETFWNDVPTELMKSLDLEARVNGRWIKLGAIDKNKTRLIKFDFAQIKATAVRIRMKETYGAKNAKLFEVRCYES